MTWYAKRTGGYSPSSNEAIANATETYTLLMRDYGWTESACAGMFGNIDFEGGWNPWRWENDHLLTKQQAIDDTTRVHGYGLIGFTPAKKYQINNATFTHEGRTYEYFPDYNQESYTGYSPNWSDIAGTPNDGMAQIKLIGEAMANGSNSIWYRVNGEPHNISSTDYIHIDDPKEACLCWLWRAERPASIFDDRRATTERNRTLATRDWCNRFDWDYNDGILTPLLTILLSRSNWWLKGGYNR